MLRKSTKKLCETLRVKVQTCSTLQWGLAEIYRTNVVWTYVPKTVVICFYFVLVIVVMGGNKVISFFFV